MRNILQLIWQWTQTHTWLQLGVSKFSPSHFHPYTWFWSVSPPPSVLPDPSSSSSSSSFSSRSCPFSTTATAAKPCSTLPLTPCFLSLFFFFFFLLLHLHLRYITPLTCLTWVISANKSTKNRENHACNVESHWNSFLTCRIVEMFLSFCTNRFSRKAHQLLSQRFQYNLSLKNSAMIERRLSETKEHLIKWLSQQGH